MIISVLIFTILKDFSELDDYEFFNSCYTFNVNKVRTFWRLFLKLFNDKNVPTDVINIKRCNTTTNFKLSDL